MVVSNKPITHKTTKLKREEGIGEMLVKSLKTFFAQHEINQKDVEES
jgi:hypothetical protein